VRPLRVILPLSALLLAAACSSGAGPGSSSGTASTAGDVPAATSTASCPSGTSATTSATATATATAAGDASAATLSATEALLGTLDDAQKESVQGEWSQDNLSQWSNLPDQLFERTGLRMDAPSAEQQAAALTVIGHYPTNEYGAKYAS